MDILKYFGFVVGSQNQIINLNGFIIAAQTSNTEQSSSTTLQPTHQTHVSRPTAESPPAPPPQPQAIATPINNNNDGNHLNHDTNGERSSTQELVQFSGTESRSNATHSEILAIFPEENTSSSSGNRSNSCNNLHLCSCCRLSNNSQLSNINYLLQANTSTASNVEQLINNSDNGNCSSNAKSETNQSKPFSDLEIEHSNCSIKKRTSDV